MAYSIIEQFSRDIDWYLLNGKNHFIHAASAGGTLPNIVKDNDFDNEQNHRIILGLPERYEIAVNPLLTEFLELTGSGDLNNYLTDFTLMARRGFYSYDKTYIDDLTNSDYHLVAWPKDYVFLKYWTSLINIDIQIPKQNLPFDLISLINRSTAND